MTTPEAKARKEIDKQLLATGWILQNISDMNIMAGVGVAVREFPLMTGEADYALYVDGKVAGVIAHLHDAISSLVGSLFDSVDSQKNRELAVERFGITSDDETVDPAELVTDEQLDEIETEQVKNALRLFHQPKLRAVLLRPEHQVIDEVTRDSLLSAGYDPQAKEKAQSLISDFRQFIEDNKDEIEAISILYSRPYAAGLRYSQIKDLARRLSIGPFHVDESQPQTLLKLWQAFGAVHPDKVDTNGKHCKHIVDLVALVRHAIDPDSRLRPVGMAVEERLLV